MLAAVAEGERRALARCFDGTEEGAIEAARVASQRASELGRAALEREPPPSPIACERGCHACCSAKIIIAAPEALRIAAYLRATRSAGELDALVAKVREVDAVTHGLSRAERAALNVPCPLLDEGICSIYEVRPLVCRGWTSLDAAACARHFTDPEREPSAPVYAQSHELAGAVLAGLKGAVGDVGLDGALLEFVAALRVVLERPNAGARWLQGLFALKTAHDREVMTGGA